MIVHNGRLHIKIAVGFATSCPTFPKGKKARKNIAVKVDLTPLMNRIYLDNLEIMQMSKTVTVIEGRGLYVSNRMICNGVPEIVETFHRPADSSPTCIRVLIRIGGFIDRCVDVAVGAPGYKTLHGAIAPVLIVPCSTRI